MPSIPGDGDAFRQPCAGCSILTGRTVTRRMGTFRRVEDMVNIGAYAKGSNPEIDEAISAKPAINAFLCQEVGDPQNLEQSMAQLRELAGMGGAPQQGMPRPAPQGPQHAAPQVARR